MKHFKNVEELLKDNLIVKFVGKGIDVKNLKEYLSEKYKISDFLKDRSFKDLLVVEMDKASLETFILLYMWKKVKGNTKLLLISSLSYPLFPEFPAYRIGEDIKEIRYVESDLFELVSEISNSSIAEGNFLIYVEKGKEQEIQDKLRNLKRKIIVTSDSYFAPKNVCVFDTMWEKRVVETITGGARMSVQRISKREAELRAGKLTYRMISLAEYEELPDFTEELIYRLPLSHVIIDIYEYKLDPFDILTGIGIPYEKIDFVYQLFLKYGILDFSSRISRKGKLLRKMCFGLRTSLLCVEGNNFPSVVLASCIENFNYEIFLYENLKDLKDEFLIDLEVETNKREESFRKFKGYSDAHTFLNLFLKSLREKDLEKWCKDNHISYSYMKSVHSGIDKVCKILNVKKEAFNVELFLLEIEPIIKNLYFEREMSLLLDSEDTYLDYQGEPYTLFPTSVNEISNFSPPTIQGLILDEDLKTINFCFANQEI
jgi:hypothetical protein